MVDGDKDASGDAVVRAYGGISLTAYAEAMAYLRHFPRHLADEVLGLLGIGPAAWQVALEGWTGVMVDGEPKDREGVAVTFGVVFARKARELGELSETLEGLRARGKGAELAGAEETEAPGAQVKEEEPIPETIPASRSMAARPLRVVTDWETRTEETSRDASDAPEPDVTWMGPLAWDAGSRPALPFVEGAREGAPSAALLAQMAEDRRRRAEEVEVASAGRRPIADQTLVLRRGAEPNQPLALERLASLTLDLAEPGVDRGVVLLRYGFVAEIEWRAVESELLRRISQEPELYRRWVDAVRKYEAWIARGRGAVT